MFSLISLFSQKQYIFDKIAAYKYDGSLSVDSQIEFIIECDPKMFRHIHNYIRFGKLLLPTDFHEHKLLIEEAKSFAMTGEYQRHLINFDSRIYSFDFRFD